MKIGRLIIQRADGRSMTVRGAERRAIMRKGGFGKKGAGSKSGGKK